ncbi:MAG: hypothetical protein H6625_00430 [Bdellovibrionaceae bacterium]|nr:hypothetical protein [Pseudobdellovibrionaceae bacterium]
MSKKALALFFAALILRLVIINIWKIPKIVYNPIELVLLGGALYFERAQLQEFFIRKGKFIQDLVLGAVLGIVLATYT